jgi:hypothetical protein
MAELHELCTIRVKVRYEPVGPTPSGKRLDAPFEGSATSPHWEGERPVTGIDYVTFRSDGTFAVDIRGRIGSGREVVAYQAQGIAGFDPDTKVTDARELFRFETAAADLAWLNRTVGVGIGGGEGDDLEVQVFTVDPPPAR